MSLRRIDRIEGTALPMRGHNIDTDRIIPARFLRAVSFEGLEAHVFEDDRATDPAHPFSNPVYQGAAVLIVNANFGCGSSREHAPQAIARRGIQAIVGESFSEIFFGNSVALGLPCVTASPEDVAFLMQAAERQPATRVAVDLPAQVVEAAGRTMRVAMPGSAREAFLTGHWDATGLLLDRYDEVERVAARLPYVQGFSPPLRPPHSP
jgi:3-isopropylmalate/(R)-2-methylmalate dehydratase small subunit